MTSSGIFYTVQENYKNGTHVSSNSMYHVEYIYDIEKNIDSRMRMFLEHECKVARNGNEIVLVSLNPDFDLHIIKFKKYL